MLRLYRFGCVGVLALTWALGGLAAAADGRLSDAQVQRLNGLTRQADRAATADPLKAYLALAEAARLEQLWTSNTLGEDAPAAQNLERFSHALVRREDGALLRVLHSHLVSKGDKVGLLRLLENDVEQQANLEE